MFFCGRWYLFVKISFEFDKYLLWSTKGGIAGIFLMSEHLETILHHHHHYHPRRRRHNSKYKVLSLKYKVHIYFCIFCKLDNQHQLVIVNRINQCQIEQKNCLCVVPWVHGKCFLSTENKRHTKQSKWAHARIQQNQTKTHILKATVIIQNTHIQTKHTQCVLRI